MHLFLLNHRDELVARCQARAALRSARAATPEQLQNGLPMFLDQLIRTLRAEAPGDPGAGLRVSDASGGDASALAEIGVTAAAHGRDLHRLGFSIDQVVHGYGDLCQAITDLAIERDRPFAVTEFRTLNRCLDHAMADAVTAFAAQRDVLAADGLSPAEHARQAVLADKLRNCLHVAQLAFTALETGLLPVGGTTGGVLKRSLNSGNEVLADVLRDIQSRGFDAGACDGRARSARCSSSSADATASSAAATS